MSQSTYGIEPSQLKAGMKADICADTCKSYKNTTGAKFPFGLMAVLGAADDRAARVAGVGEKLIGVTVHSHGVSDQGLAVGTSDLAFGATDTTVYGYPDKRVMDVMRVGVVVVAVEGAVSAESQPYVRIAANGANTVLGGFRGDGDVAAGLSTARRIRGARFITSTSAAGFALLFIFGELGWSVDDADVGGDLGLIRLTAGAEGAIAANAIEVQGVILDANGLPITSAKAVHICTTPTTADLGDIAAAGTPVGTGFFAQNPVTGDNNASMLSTALGLFAFRVTNTAVEVTDVLVDADSCRQRVLRLTFA